MIEPCAVPGCDQEAAYASPRPWCAEHWNEWIDWDGEEPEPEWMKVPCSKCGETHVQVGIGDFFEDCGYHPCLCVRIDRFEDSCNDDLMGISLVTGHMRSCSLFSCGVQRLSPRQAARWRLHGPQAWGKGGDPSTWENKWWEDYKDFKMGVYDFDTGKKLEN